MFQSSGWRFVRCPMPCKCLRSIDESFTSVTPFFGKQLFSSSSSPELLSSSLLEHGRMPKSVLRFVGILVTKTSKKM